MYYKKQYLAPKQEIPPGSLAAEPLAPAHDELYDHFIGEAEAIFHEEDWEDGGQL